MDNRSLRKARVQMNDLARERDAAKEMNESLRNELREQHARTESIRNSMGPAAGGLAEQQQKEARLREADERTRAQLQARLAEMNSRKKGSKCEWHFLHDFLVCDPLTSHCSQLFLDRAVQ